MAKQILCGFGVDVDAVAGWLGSHGGEDSPDNISRGLEVGSSRLLKLFARLGIKPTWFIPGHSIETFPAEMKAVAEARARQGQWTDFCDGGAAAGADMCSRPSGWRPCPGSKRSCQPEGTAGHVLVRRC
jgi:peptidoglycan/xylan/chitin deacetylase (PgdA/CDA1 family)